MQGIYYYHPDHLGSANWITDLDERPVEYLHYMPYGEPWQEQHRTTYDERYKFTGKERDAETEYDYFGARYYASVLPTWLSVDPLSDKYPSISPYAYCSWNPVKYVDPDGRDWYDSGDGNIMWDDKATSQEAMNKVGLKGVYLGKNVLVGKHGRDENLNEDINGAIFELYLETDKTGAIASIKGNTIPCDITYYGTLKEGRYPARYQEYKGKPAILINEGGDLPTIKGNFNNPENYLDKEMKNPKPIEMHIMDAIYFHYGNNYFPSLMDTKKTPWTTGCQTGGNYKGSWIDYITFMQNVPITFNGWYYLRAK